MGQKVIPGKPVGKPAGPELPGPGPQSMSTPARPMDDSNKIRWLENKVKRLETRIIAIENWKLKAERQRNRQDGKRLDSRIRRNEKSFGNKGGFDQGGTSGPDDSHLY